MIYSTVIEKACAVQRSKAWTYNLLVRFPLVTFIFQLLNF